MRTEARDSFVENIQANFITWELGNLQIFLEVDLKDTMFSG